MVVEPPVATGSTLVLRVVVVAVVVTGSEEPQPVSTALVASARIRHARVVSFFMSRSLSKMQRRWMMSNRVSGYFRVVVEVVSVVSVVVVRAGTATAVFCTTTLLTTGRPDSMT